MAQLMERNPFTRMELHRRVYAPANSGHDCSWCGTKDRKLYEYWCESDGGRSSEYSGTFCCQSCFKAYHYA